MSLGRRRLLLAACAAGVGSAARPLGAQTLETAGGRITVVADAGFSAQQMQDIKAWVQRAADAVSSYLGRFPRRLCELRLQRVPGAGVRGGTTYPEPEPWVRVRLGEAVNDAQLRDDWVLVHEMLHLAVPQVPRAQNWLHEGLATYIEGAARVQAGLNTAPRWWAELVRGLPQGQARAGDRGLDHTPSWGRIYWGGALFCLLADVRLLERSGTRQGLRQAMQGLLAAGGSYAQAWPVRRILEVADQAVQQHTLIELYESMKDSAQPVDLAALWQQLGVVVEAGQDARFNDKAALAAVRRAIA